MGRKNCNEKSKRYAMAQSVSCRFLTAEGSV